MTSRNWKSTWEEQNPGEGYVTPKRLQLSSYSNEINGNAFLWTDFCVKGKAVPQHTYGGAEGERRYTSTSLLTSALDEGEWSESRSGRPLPPEERTPHFFFAIMNPESCLAPS
jgi:hypothetical protein